MRQESYTGTLAALTAVYQTHIYGTATALTLGALAFVVGVGIGWMARRAGIVVNDC